MQPDAIQDAALPALLLIGNASSRISRMQREKIIGSSTRLYPPPPLPKRTNHLIWLHHTCSVQTLPERVRSSWTNSRHCGPLFPQSGRKLTDSPFFRGGSSSKGWLQIQERSFKQLQGQQNKQLREAHSHRQIDSPHIVPVTSYHVHAAVHSIALVQSTREIIARMGVAHLCTLEQLAGRPSHFASNWEIVTKEQWVLNTVRGYRIQFASDPHQSRRPHPVRFNQSQGKLIKQEVEELLFKGTIVENQTPPAEFSLHPLSGPQKGWRAKTCHQPESTHRIRECTSFQNEGHPHPENPPSTQVLGMDCKSRSERCILFHPDTPRSQEIPSFPVSRQDISIHLPPIQPSLTSLGLYQDPQASNSSSTRAGDVGDSLHRRLSPDGGVQGEATQSNASTSLTFWNVWVLS